MKISISVYILANCSVKVEHSAMVRKVVGSIPGRVIPKTSKIVLDASLLSAPAIKEKDQG